MECSRWWWRSSVIAGHRLPRGSRCRRCTTIISSAWSALRLRFRRLRRRSSIFRFRKTRTGNAAAGSPARSAELVGEETCRSRGTGAQNNAGRHESTSAGREADDPEATGQDECVLQRKFGDANRGSGAAESANRRLWRSQRRGRGGALTAVRSRSRRRVRSICPLALATATARADRMASRGVVASTGFGNGVATGNSSGRFLARAARSAQGGFGDADIVAASSPNQGPPNRSSKPCRPRSHSSRVRFTLMKGGSLRLRARSCSMLCFQRAGRFAL